MFFGIAAVCMLVLLSVSDLRSRTIPVPPVLVFAAVMAAVHLAAGDLTGLQILAGTLPGLFLLTAGLVSKSAIGTGDGITAAACGAAVGFYSELASLTAALLLCSVFSIVLLIRKKAGRNDSLPFLPFLTAGHILVLISEVRI